MTQKCFALLRYPSKVSSEYPWERGNELIFQSSKFLVLFLSSRSYLDQLIFMNDYTGYFTILSGFKNFIKQKVNKIKQ